MKISQTNRTQRYGLGVITLSFICSISVILAHNVTTLFLGICLLSGLILLQFAIGMYKDMTRPSVLFSVFFMSFIILGVIFENILRGFSEVTFQAVIHSSLVYTFSLYVFQKNKPPRSRVKVKFVDNRKWLAIISFIISAIGILSGFLFFLKIGHIPLLSNASPESRISAMQGNGSLLQPLRSAPIAAIALTFGTSYKKTGLFFFFVSNSLFLGTGFRGFFVQNILFLGILYFLVNGRRLDYRHMFAFGIVIIFTVFSLGLIRGDGAIIASLGLKIAHAFSVSIYILEVTLDNFTEFKYGSTFLYKFTSILPIPNIEYSQWLTKQLPISFKGGVTPTLIGDFYINFGSGYFILFAPLAWILTRLDTQAVSTQRITSLLMISTISMGIARSVTGGLSNTIFQTVLLCFIIFILSIFSRMKNH